MTNTPETKELPVPSDTTQLIDVLIWIQEQFAKYKNNDVDLLNFTNIMAESKQFKSKNDAKEYFELLDIDKDGSVNFSEFLAPILPELKPDEVSILTAKNRITLDDLTQLRIIFNRLSTSQEEDPVNESQKVAHLTNFLLEVKTHKKETLTRAYKQMVELLSSKTKTNQKLSSQEFSKTMATLENSLLKRCCLYNYFDTKHNEIIKDFTVNFRKDL